MITCRACNTPNPDEAQFCTGCGAPLTDAPATPAGAINCPSCNAANPPEAQFCVSCGAPLSTAPVYEVTPTAAPAQSPAPAPLPEAAPTPPGFAPAQPAAPEPYAPSPIPAYTTASGAVLKSRTTALLLEILPALFGFFGIGWIYSGNITAGVLWLIGMLTWEFIALLLSIATLGLGCFCFVPLNLVVMGISAYFLNEYTLRHSEEFGPKVA